MVEDQLPLFMLPERIFALAALPRNERGKIDYDALDARAGGGISTGAIMLTHEITAGHDFAHDSRALGRRKVAHILPSPAEIAAGRPAFVMLHPFGGNRTLG